ncbi:MAG: lyase family protein [Planctomycetota bacterium]
MPTPTQSPNDRYVSPLSQRYASAEMQAIWSPRRKFETWRKIWLAVAEAQHEITKDDDTPLVTREQVEELRANLDVTDADIELAAKYERELRHDVMAHVHAWGDRCPKAKGIIHLGMTSQDINDNAELLLMHDAWSVIDKGIDLLRLALAVQAERHMSLPALGLTHYQPAQPTTMGRRFATHLSDLYYFCNAGLSEYGFEDGEPRLRGFRGATGTQASYASLFGGNEERVLEFEARALWNLHKLHGDGTIYDSFEGELESADSSLRMLYESTIDTLEQMPDEHLTGTKLTEQEASAVREKRAASIASSFGIPSNRVDSLAKFIGVRTIGLTGQTYPRIHDTIIVSVLASIAALLHKCATDIRLLCNRKEVDEPFEEHQIGSSAMPYKRNPMRCERVCAITRFVMNLVGNTYETAATQWLERTLDDSANRRLVLPEAFLALDGALDVMRNVISGLVVHEAQVRKNLMAELPFLATENIMMEAVKAGGDRQELHEKIRMHAQHVAWRIKQEGADNDLIERLRNDPAFESIKDRLTEGDLLDPMKYVGLAVEQTERFVKEVIEPLRENLDDESGEVELRV